MTTRELVLSRLSMISGITLPADEDIPAETKLNAVKDRFAVDSLEMAELFMDLEDNTGVEFSDKAIGEFRTLGDIVAHIEAGRTAGGVRANER